jgi:DNA-binding Lrp family transcriptional regulator
MSTTHPPIAEKRMLFLPIYLDWLYILKNATGTSDPNTCLTLATIYSWYLPNEDGSARFAGDALQLQSKYIADKLNISPKTANQCLKKLEMRGLITRSHKDITYQGRVWQERQYIRLCPAALYEQGFISQEQATRLQEVDTICTDRLKRSIPIVSTHNESSKKVDTDCIDLPLGSIPIVSGVDTIGIERSIQSVSHTYNNNTNIQTNTQLKRGGDFSLKNLSEGACITLLMGWGKGREEAERLAREYMETEESPTEQGLRDSLEVGKPDNAIVVRQDSRLEEILKLFNHPMPNDEGAQRSLRRECLAFTHLAGGKDPLDYVYEQFLAYCSYKAATKTKYHGTAQTFLDSLNTTDYCLKWGKEAKQKDESVVYVESTNRPHEKTLLEKFDDILLSITRGASREPRTLQSLIENIFGTYAKKCTSPEEFSKLYEVFLETMKAAINTSEELIYYKHMKEMNYVISLMRTVWLYSCNLSGEKLQNEFREESKRFAELAKALIASQQNQEA